MNAGNFLPTIIAFLGGYLLSSIIKDFVIVKVLQKILDTPEEKMTKSGLVILGGTVEGIKMLMFTKNIGVLGLNISAFVSVVLVFIFMDFISFFEAMIMLPLLNLVTSSFLVCVAMVNKPFFMSLLASNDGRKAKKKPN